MISPKPEVLDVVLVFDDSHARHAAVVVHSAASVLATGFRIRAHCIVSGLEAPSEEGLARVAADHSNLEVLLYRSTAARYESWLHGGHISPAAYLRLELGNHLPSDVKRAVYLDTDLLCRQSLHQLFRVDSDKRTVGAVRDTTTPVVSAPRGIVNYSTLGIAPDAPYFNSGVMLIDVERWRVADPVAFGERYVQANGDVQQALDQELLNACFAGDWIELPLRWNVSPRLTNMDAWEADRRSFFEAEAETAIADPAIVHFLGPRKPWRFRSDGPWASEYLLCARSCAFYRNRRDFLLWRANEGVAEIGSRVRHRSRALRRRTRSAKALLRSR